MKTHELAKELNVKSTEVMVKAKELGMRKLAINSGISEEEAAELRDNLVAVEKAPIVTQVDKQGAMIGIVHDGEKFNIVSINITMDQLSRLNCEVLHESNTVFGARIEMEKRVRQVINENTVKVFKK